MCFKQLSRRSNGCLVRLVGRVRVKDGVLNCVVAYLLFFLLFPFWLYTLCKARFARSSWKQTLFDLYSVGTDPSASSCGEKPVEAVRFVFISDTHMRHESLPRLPAGDVLVHTGDFTNHGSMEEVSKFAAWFRSQPHETKIIVPGNHDMVVDKEYYDEFWSDWSSVQENPDEALAELQLGGVHVLLDYNERLSVRGITIRGSPYVTQYAAWSTAFNKTPAAMQKHWAGLLPHPEDRTLVLLTHMPPKGFGDMEPDGTRVGCPHLLDLVRRVQPRVHAFGHVHSQPGKHLSKDDLSLAKTVFLNASSVSDFYGVGRRSAHVIDVYSREDSTCRCKTSASSASSSLGDPLLND